MSIQTGRLNLKCAISTQLEGKRSFHDVLPPR